MLPLGPENAGTTEENAAHTMSRFFRASPSRYHRGRRPRLARGARGGTPVGVRVPLLALSCSTENAARHTKHRAPHKTPRTAKPRQCAGHTVALTAAGRRRKPRSTSRSRVDSRFGRARPFLNRTEARLTAQTKEAVVAGDKGGSGTRPYLDQHHWPLAIRRLSPVAIPHERWVSTNASS
jgi:hypothetical protein